MATSVQTPVFDEAMFANQIHAFSLLDFHADIEMQSVNYAANAYGPDTTISKHLSLLDGLALLLIKSPKSEVVATTMRLTSESFILYWARNDNQASQAEQQYMNLLRKYAEEQTPATEILPHVVDYTKRKIVSRCQKLAKHYELNQQNQKLDVQNIMNVDTRTLKYHQLEEQLKQRRIIKPDRRLVDYLDKFIRAIARVNAQAKTQNLAKIIGQAFELCTKVHKLESLVDREQNDKFRKLSDYLYAISHFQKEVSRLSSKGIREIRFEQRFANQHPHRKEVEGPLIRALNKWAAQQPGLAQITSFEGQVKARFHDAQEGPPGSTRIDQCQHAELTLALFLINTSQSAGAGGTYEIGVSKSSCYWCSIWLDLANTALSMASRKTEIVVRATHGKRTDGWLLPQDKHVAHLFLLRFNSEFRSHYDTALTGRRRSDSKPLSEKDAAYGDDVNVGEEPDFD